MNVALVTSSSFYWGPQLEQMAMVLRACGHAVWCVHDQNLQRFERAHFDLLFCLGSGESLLPFLKRLSARCRLLYLLEGIPTLTEADEFTRSKIRVHLATLTAFDAVFVHTRRSLPLLHQLGLPRVEELLWPWCPALYHPRPGTLQDLELLFVGTLSPYRHEMLRHLQSRFAVTVVQGAFHQEFTHLTARAKLLLNLHYTPLRNCECRITEGLGCGALLVTEALEPDDVFRDGEHLVVITRENALETIGHYLADPPACRRIASQGHAAVARYRVDLQMQRVLDVATELLAKTSPPPDLR